MPRRNLNLLISPVEDPPSDNEDNDLEKPKSKKKSKP